MAPGARWVARHGRRLLKLGCGVVDVMALLLLERGMVLQFLGEGLDVLAAGTVVAVVDAFDLGVDGLVETAELQLLTLRRVQQLLGASGGRVEGVVLLLVGLGRRRVVGHLREHPVVHLELR